MRQSKIRQKLFLVVAAFLTAFAAMTKKHGSGGDGSGYGVNKNDGKNNKCCKLLKINTQFFFLEYYSCSGSSTSITI